VQYPKAENGVEGAVSRTFVTTSARSGQAYRRQPTLDVGIPPSICWHQYTSIEKTQLIRLGAGLLTRRSRTKDKSARSSAIGKLNGMAAW